MSNQPLVSVIVPIYHVERYVGKCIESIIEQTYPNLEIILVDDGGQDACPLICDLYSRKDPRIKVIHKPNGGLVSARKAGLAIAGGEYVLNVDGDDWIGTAYVETLVKEAVSSQADIVCAGYSIDVFSSSECVKEHHPAGIYEEETLTALWKTMISSSAFYRPGITSYLWNKLFKKEIVYQSQMRVDEHVSNGEDAAVTYPALLNAKRVSILECYEYHYRQHEDSMLKTTSGYSADAQKLQDLYQSLMDWAKTQDSSLELERQVKECVYAMALMRSGGYLSKTNTSVFGQDWFGKRVAVVSAGTFGQQLVNRLKEHHLCTIAGWVDERYKQYRRVCLDVDPFAALKTMDYDAVLIAKIASETAEKIKSNLLAEGIREEVIHTVQKPEDLDEQLNELLDAEYFRKEEKRRNRE